MPLSAMFVEENEDIGYPEARAVAYRELPDWMIRTKFRSSVRELCAF